MKGRTKEGSEEGVKRELLSLGKRTIRHWGDGGGWHQHTHTHSHIHTHSHTPTLTHTHSLSLSLSLSRPLSSLCCCSVVHFPVDLADGKVHLLLLSVSAPSARLVVDGELIATRDVGVDTLSDCSPAGINCLLYIGQRSSVAGGAFRFSGQIFLADLYPTEALAGFPYGLISPSAVAFDLLRPRVHDAALTPVDASGAYAFPGDTALTLTSMPSIAANMTVVVDVEQAAGTAGYVFAKTGAGGVRYWALYASSFTNTVTLFYRTRGSDAQRSLRFAYDLSSSEIRTVTVAVAGARVVVEVDGEEVGAANIGGVLDDCTLGPDCTFTVGSRVDASGNAAVFFTGTIHRALLYPDTTLSL